MFKDVLVVDDERDICDLVAGVLEDEGYEARIAQDSDSALRRLPVAVPQWCCLMCGCRAVVWTVLRF